MSRRKASKQSNNRSIIPLLMIPVIFIAVFFVVNAANAPVEENAAITRISPQDYQENYASDDHMLIDVRTPAEFADGHIQGAVNIPLDSLPGRLNELPTDKPLVVYCRSGNRSATAVNIMADAGLTGIADMGGIISWAQAGYPVVQ